MSFILAFFIFLFLFGPPLALISVAVYFAVKGCTRKQWMSVALIAGGYIITALAFWTSWEGTHWVERAIIVGFGALFWLFLVGLMNRRRKLLAALGVGLILLGGARWGFSAFQDYKKSITVPETFDWTDYLPTPDNPLVATLDEPSTLRLSGERELPRLDGATALYPVYAAFARAAYPEDLLESSVYAMNQVTCGTTGLAYRAIVNGGADIIFAAGPSEAQEAYAAEQGMELIYTPIGREAFVFFVNPNNPIEDVTLDELRGVYAGAITKWEELGAKGMGEILAFQRSEGSGSQTALERFVMGDTPLMAAPKEYVADSMLDIVERVSPYRNFNNAIGYSFRFYCTELLKGFDVKLLTINGVAPTKENIENGAYPLASYFYAVTRADAGDQVKAFMDWITGPQGQALVEKAGYTPVSGGAE